MPKGSDSDPIQSEPWMLDSEPSPLDLGYTGPVLTVSSSVLTEQKKCAARSTLEYFIFKVRFYK